MRAALTINEVLIALIIAVFASCVDDVIMEKRALDLQYFSGNIDMRLNNSPIFYLSINKIEQAWAL